MIVDDEVGPRESLRMILKPIYEIYTATNGDEALQVIQNENIDLVTLDLRSRGSRESMSSGKLKRSGRMWK